MNFHVFNAGNLPEKNFIYIYMGFWPGPQQNNLTMQTDLL